MGWFSSKTKHVYTPYSGLLYDKVPSLMKQTMVGAIPNNRNLASDLIANLVSGTQGKCNAYYSNATRKDHPWGLPEEAMGHIMPVAHDRIALIIGEEVFAKVHIGFANITTDGVSYQYDVQYYHVERGKINYDRSYTWEYDTKTGTYPILNPLPSQRHNPYYPVTPLRVDNVNYDKDHEHGVEVTRALRFLGLKSRDLFEAFEDASKESEEETADDQFVLLAASITDDSQEVMEYLYRFWRKQHAASVADENDYKYWESQVRAYEENPDIFKGVPPLRENILTISDSRYHQVLRWDFTRYSIKEGVVAKVGKHARSFNPLLGVTSIFSKLLATEEIAFQHQINETQYEEILVHGPVCEYLVCAGGWEGVSLTDAFSEPDEATGGQCFIIPLRRDIVREMGSIKAHDLLNRSIRLFSNDHRTYKVKWYQRGFMKVVLLVAAIVLNCISLGATTPLTIAVVAAVTVIVALVIEKIVMPMLQNLLGEELALVAALVLAYFAPQISTEIFTQIGVTAATTTVAATSTFTTALHYGQIAIQGIGGVASLNQQNKLKELEDQYKSASEKLEEFYETSHVDPYQLQYVMNGIRSDPYYLMEANNFVKYKQKEHLKPTLITGSTALFIKTRQALDTSTTVINLGHF